MGIVVTFALLAGTMLTTRQRTNAFYIQSPRLHKNGPIAVPKGRMADSASSARSGQVSTLLTGSTLWGSSLLGSCDAHHTHDLSRRAIRAIEALTSNCLPTDDPGL